MLLHLKIASAVCRPYHSAPPQFYMLDIHAPSPAYLPILAFEGATKNNRPRLERGSLVMCRVAGASAHTDAELDCRNARGL